MSAVSENIVREYFELHGFFVRQQRKYVATNRPEHDQVDFFVLNPRAVVSPNQPFVLSSGDLAGVSRALVVVKGWHTERFSPAVLANAPEIFRFVEPTVFAKAAKAFGEGDSLTRILVVPALPNGKEAQRQSIEMLRSKGIDAVIPFRVMLADLVEKVEVNRNYQKSDLLQILRILKNYEFFRDSQMELFRPKKAGKKTSEEK